MMEDNISRSQDGNVANYEENIAKILDRAVKLFQKTRLYELSSKWEKILNTYKSKKQT